MDVMKEYRQVTAAVGFKNARVRTSLQIEVCSPQWLPVELPHPRGGRSAAMVRIKSWFNIAVCACLHSSLTHHRNIENKVWERDFWKEVCSFVHWSSSLSLIMFPLIYIFIYVYVYIYSCMWVYNNYSFICTHLNGFMYLLFNPIYPTPPLGQDMTPGQFLSGVWQFSFS